MREVGEPKLRVLTPKARRSSSEWSVNTDTIYSIDAIYEIDAALRKILKEDGGSQLEPSSRDERVLLSKGRRALEVAILSASIAKDAADQSDAGIIEWERITALSRKAGSSLKELLEYIAGPGNNFCDPVAISHVLRQIETHRRHQKENKQFVRSARIAANKQTDYLLRALASMSDIEEAGAKKQKAVGASRKNFGNAGKNAFVQRMAEFWVWITGVSPPTGDVTDFQDILRAAWNDAGQDDTTENFLRSILGARELLTPEKLNQINAVGPHWK